MPAQSRQISVNRLESRRIKEDGKIVVLPPEGFGDAWSGSGGTKRDK